jgi:hypothetical protein
LCRVAGGTTPTKEGEIEVKNFSIEEARDRAPEKYPDRWTAIPPNGGARCQFTGMRHGRLYQWLNGPAKGRVRVVSLKEEGRNRGTRLFHVGDALRFLDALARTQVKTEVG